MSESRPIWQEIPSHFKQDVVGNLDFKSRLSLSKCSKSDQELVKNCPLHFELFFVEGLEGKINVQFQINKVTYKKLLKQECIETFARCFLNVFETPKTTCEKLWIEWDNTFFNFVKFVSDHHTVKFKVTLLKPHFISFEFFLRVLDLMDPDFFDHLVIPLKVISTEEQKKQLVAMKQWRFLKSLLSIRQSPSFFQIQDVLHLKSLSMSDLQLTPREVDTLIQSFCVKQLPLHSGFEILDIKTEIPIAKDHGPRSEDIFLRKHYWTKTYPTASENHHLIVEFSSEKPDKFNRIKGTVCHKSRCHHDYIEFFRFFGAFFDSSFLYM